jgi:CRISPR-associated protein Cmr4
MNVQKPDLLFFYAESPVHWGTGTSVGVVDLPIQRERHTDYPTGQSSGIKGALRDWFESARAPFVSAAFGPESNASDHAGCVAFGDARLVLFPVRTLRGTFAYCTSRVLLARLARDLELAGAGQTVSAPGDSEMALVAKGSPLLHQQRMAVEEFPVDAAESDAVAAIGAALGKLCAPDEFWEKRIASHLAVLPDDLFRDLARTATTIETHVRIDNETGTADDGGLFYEELLPSDSVLYSPIYVAEPLRSRNGSKEAWPSSAAEVRTMVAELDRKRVQMGAGATTGRGIVHCRFLAGGKQ